MMTRHPLLRAWRASISVSDLTGECDLCETPHPDTTPSECRMWAKHRAEWHARELKRLRTALGGEVTA